MFVHVAHIQYAYQLLGLGGSERTGFHFFPVILYLVVQGCVFGGTMAVRLYMGLELSGECVPTFFVCHSVLD